jgi:hypothetical protein
MGGVRLRWEWLAADRVRSIEGIRRWYLLPRRPERETIAPSRPSKIREMSVLGKGIFYLPIVPEDFELLRGKNALTVYTFGTDVAQHTLSSHCGTHAFYILRSQPDRITVNALSRRHRRA